MVLFLTIALLAIVLSVIAKLSGVNLTIAYFKIIFGSHTVILVIRQYLTSVSI
jgi:hypothetical protein